MNRNKNENTCYLDENLYSVALSDLNVKLLLVLEKLQVWNKCLENSIITNNPKKNIANLRDSAE